MFGKGLFDGDSGVFLQHLEYLCQVCAEFFDGFTGLFFGIADTDGEVTDFSVFMRNIFLPDGVLEVFQ